MGIYNRDYRKLTEDEKAKYRAIKEKENITTSGGKKTRFRRVLFHECPKAVRHYKQLFPNYYLDVAELKEKEVLNEKTECFSVLLEKHCIEQDILKFIKEKNAYFIIASILKRHYNFGHHATFIMPEFQLGCEYRADYLLIGRSSGGYEFVFVELESPYGNITTKDGELGSNFRKGIKQVNDWRRWLERNYSILREVYKKELKDEDQLPKEFIEYDSSRIHYVVISGRRSDFKELTYNIKREKLKNEDILLLHYDNLIDFSKDIVGKATY